MLGAPSTRLPRPEWALGEAPMPLMRELPPPSPFPIDALGGVGSAVVELMHHLGLVKRHPQGVVESDPVWAIAL